MSSKGQYKDVDDYIIRAPANVQATLHRIRATIQKVAPDAVESISYGMPAYKFAGKPLVYFAVFPHHIGFYATPQSHEAFSKELAKYKQGKGSVQFPLNQPIPYELIKTMVAFKKDLLKNK
ncbi:MAG TPA: DUF1801 domain-containing protein [Candidatus Saccharimonadales bacterium]|nr:DUF1801 domain-containing protein [Candidatus Saccharimonadales bacterium]